MTKTFQSKRSYCPARLGKKKYLDCMQLNLGAPVSLRQLYANCGVNIYRRTCLSNATETNKQTVPRPSLIRYRVSGIGLKNITKEGRGTNFNQRIGILPATIFPSEGLLR